MNTLPSGVEIGDHTNAPTSNALITTDRPKQMGFFIESQRRGMSEPGIFDGEAAPVNRPKVRVSAIERVFLWANQLEDIKRPA
jgi:hypothetical protein